jgi:hypothetical protein
MKTLFQKLFHPEVSEDQIELYEIGALALDESMNR